MQWSASCPNWFTPGTCRTQSCMDHKATLDTTEKRKLFVPAENETPIPLSPSLWPSNYTELYQLLEEPAASMYPWWQRPNILLQCWCSNNRLYLTSQNTTFSLSSSLRLKISPVTNIRLAVTSSSWSSEHHPNHLCNHLENIKLQCNLARNFQLHCLSWIVNFSIYVFGILIYQQGAVCWECYTFLYIPLLFLYTEYNDKYYINFKHPFVLANKQNQTNNFQKHNFTKMIH